MRSDSECIKEHLAAIEGLRLLYAAGDASRLADNDCFVLPHIPEDSRREWLLSCAQSARLNLKQCYGYDTEKPDWEIELEEAIEEDARAKALIKEAARQQFTRLQESDPWESK